MKPSRPASLSLADPAVLATMLPRPATSTPDPLRNHLVRLFDAALSESHLYRVQLAAVIDAIVAEQMVVPLNRAEHPFTPEQLADIEAAYRNHWAQVALNAAKEQQ